MVILDGEYIIGYVEDVIRYNVNFIKENCDNEDYQDYDFNALVQHIHDLKRLYVDFDGLVRVSEHPMGGYLIEKLGVIKDEN